MIMNLKVVSQNLSPLCFFPNGGLLCYRNGNLIRLNNGEVEKCYPVFYLFKERWLSRYRKVVRLLRLGIRSAIAIDDNHVLLSIGNMLYEYDFSICKLSSGYFIGKGIRPLVFTSVLGIVGFDDGIYFGGYLGNKNKEIVNVYKRIGTDQWIVVYTFFQGIINHVHNIVADPYRCCLWIFTGDFDSAAAIWKVEDNFRKVERVLCNNQKYRACVVFVLPEGLLYATDAPFTDNYVYLLNIETLEVEKKLFLSGSCIYGCQWKDKYVFSSTVEGDGRNMSLMEFLFSRTRGAGIKDDCVHLYIGDLEEGFMEIYQERKDHMPFYTFQFGVFKFPNGINEGMTLYFQPIATKKNDLSLMALKLSK